MMGIVVDDENVVHVAEHLEAALRSDEILDRRSCGAKRKPRLHARDQSSHRIVYVMPSRYGQLHNTEFNAGAGEGECHLAVAEHQIGGPEFRILIVDAERDETLCRKSRRRAAAAPSRWGHRDRRRPCHPPSPGEELDVGSLQIVEVAVIVLQMIRLIFVTTAIAG